MSQKNMPRQCRKCKKLFVPMGVNQNCPECVQKLDDAFVKVREFLYESPGASMEEILDVSPDVTTADVDRWIREGRLLTAQGSTLGKCGRCGKPIQGGRLCGECAQAIGTMYQAPDKSSLQTSVERTGKMRVGRDKEKR